MNNSNTDIKKKIIYRSNYRGSKEMDLLLGKFAKKYINLLEVDDLIELDNFLQIDDDNLLNFYKGKKTMIKIPKNKISELFKLFKY